MAEINVDTPSRPTTDSIISIIRPINHLFSTHMAILSDLLKYIQNRDHKKIAELIADERAVLELDTNECDGLFRRVLVAVKQFYKEKSHNSAEKCVKLFYDLHMDDLFVVYRQIIIMLLRRDIEIDLIQAFTFYRTKNEKYLNFLFNSICFLKYERNKNTNLNDLVELLPEKPTRNTDYYVMEYYKGIVFINDEKLFEGYEALLKAAKCTKLLNPVLDRIKHVNLFSRNRIVRKQNELLVKTVCGGLVDCVNHVIPVTDVFYTVIQKYTPLVCYRNLIQNYHNSIERNKIDLNPLLAAVAVDEGVFFLNILKCIDLGIIRGYLSINKKVLVLSKAMPFPDLVN